MNMFTDKNIDAIICFRGGYGSIRLIPYLDFEVIKNNPKPFCGYSDITLLLNLIYRECNFPTFHSPMVNSDFSDTITKEYFINILNNSNQQFSYNLKDFNTSIEIINSKDFNGTLVGGNLSIICSTLATPYEVYFDNSILLLEEVDESPYVIDRLLTQLIVSNKLVNCTGILLGHFTNCTASNADDSFSLYDIIIDKLTPLNIPIIKGFPCGHSYPNITLPIGCNLEFSNKNHTLKLKENLFL